MSAKNEVCWFRSKKLIERLIDFFDRYGREAVLSHRSQIRRASFTDY